MGAFFCFFLRTFFLGQFIRQSFLNLLENLVKSKNDGALDN